MSAVFSTASAATRVATRAAAGTPKTSSSARASISTASLSNNAAAASRSASFFQGERAASFALRRQTSQMKVTQRPSAKRVVSASATPAPVVKAAAPAEWKGAKLKPLGFSVLAGLIIWLCPVPAGVTTKAWHLLAIFVGTIVGIITNVSTRETLRHSACNKPGAIAQKK